MTEKAKELITITQTNSPFESNELSEVDLENTQGGARAITAAKIGWKGICSYPWWKLFPII